MKKAFFSCLIGLVLIVPGLSIVGGCPETKENKYINADGNSIWALLPGLDDADKSFDSSDVWREVLPFLYGHDKEKITDPKLWPPKQRAKLALSLLKILSVSLLSNWNNSDYQLADKNWADYQFLNQRMTKAWTDLKQNTDDEIVRKKDEYKDKYGKNWKDKWQDMLDDQYDGKEKKYKAELLATGEDNASLELTKILIKNNQNSYITSTPQTISNAWALFKRSGKKWSAWVDLNPALARLIALSATEYRTGQVIAPLWSKDQTEQLTKSDVKNWIKSQSTPGFRYSVANRNYNSKKNRYQPRSISNSSYSTGLLSEFQKFVASKWFQWEKPLAVSSVKFLYNTNIPGGEKGLYNGLFSDNDPSHTQITQLFKKDDIANINHVINELRTESWTALSTKHYVSPVYDDHLLTLSGSGKKLDGLTEVSNADYRKTIIYSNMSNLTSKTDPPSFVADEGGSWLRGLLTKGHLDRSSGKRMGQVFGIGAPVNKIRDRVVTFFDEKGLNIVHIDGLWGVLQQNNGQGQSTFNYQDSIASAQDQPTSYDDFENYIKPNIKSGVSAADIIADGTWSFNPQIANLYLQYLVNRSYINRGGHGQSLTKFNVSDSVNNFALLNSSSSIGSHLWYTWIYDFYNYYFQNLAEKKEPGWFHDFIDFKKSVDQKKSWNWFTNALRNHDFGLRSIQDFLDAIRKLNTSIRAAGDEPGSYPKGLFFEDQKDQKIYELIKKILKENTQTNSLFWFNGGLK